MSGGVNVLVQEPHIDGICKETAAEKGISVLLVDDNPDLSKAMEEYINRSEDMKVIGQARDGIQATEMIRKLSPDIVVLDIIMPGIDGIGVLEKMQSVPPEKRPAFVILSAIKHDLIVQKAMLMGADYYIIKPFNMELLVRRIQQAYSERYIYPMLSEGIKDIGTDKTISGNEDRKIETIVTGLIKSIGIPPHITGYQYLREAVIFTVRNFKYPVPVMKVIYPEVANIFSTTAQKVERAIRNAIDSTWNKFNGNNSGPLFGSKHSKPTNSELIATIVEKAKTMLG